MVAAEASVAAVEVFPSRASAAAGALEAAMAAEAGADAMEAAEAGADAAAAGGAVAA